MTTTLSEGVKVPDVGSVNWAGDLEVNWNLLNGALANLSGNVKTDRDNTWTGEQSFTLPIVGSITGTASKAIADEDGTSIKTGYVNVAGNQTVTGQKTWSGNQFYTAGAYHRNNSYEIGNTPASNVAIPIYFTDKVNAHTGYVRNVILTTGKTQSELLARNKFTSGALSPTGTDVSSTLQVEVQSNGDKTLYFDGSIRNNILPYATNTYALGSSSYQWSSVYAQTYYYNGAAWGLDKANTWTGRNKFRSFGVQSANTIDITQSTYANSQNCGGIGFSDAADRFWGDIELNVTTDATSEMVFNLSNWKANETQGVTALRFSYDKALTTVNFFGANRVVNLGTSTNKWKTINGINPGILNHVDASVTPVDIDTTDWVLDGSAWNTFNTSSYIDGWLYLSYMQCAVDDYVSVRLGSTNYLKPTLLFKAEKLADNKYYIYATIPVTKKFNIYLEIKTSGTLVSHCLYPSLGNV